MTKQEIKKRIAELKREIKYEKQTMEYCAYSSSDLKYLYALEQELMDLENQL